MYEEITKPLKGKGKEKDLGKRRAYVRMVTSLGGSLNLELYCEKVRQPHNCSAGEYLSTTNRLRRRAIIFLCWRGRGTTPT
jgi:hypothetical protein